MIPRAGVFLGHCHGDTGYLDEIDYSLTFVDLEYKKII